MTHKILIVDDEKEIRRFLTAGLETGEFQVIEAATGKEGVQFAATYNPDIAIIDLGLPDIDGLEVISRIREWSSIPIIVLSARGEDASKVHALEGGADDYLTKPFSVPELRARIGAHLRRSADSVKGEVPTFVFGDVLVDLSQRSVRRDGQEVHLTPLEFDLLALLVRNPNKVLSHQLILTRVWGPAYAGQTQNLRVFMANLRNKLEKTPAEPAFLKTEPGIGYRLKLD